MQSILQILVGMPSEPAFLLDALFVTYTFATDADTAAAAAAASAAAVGASPPKPRLRRMQSAPLVDSTPKGFGVEMSSRRLSPSTAEAVFNLLDHHSLTSLPAARAWALCLRLLHRFGSPGVILRGAASEHSDATGASDRILSMLQTVFHADANIVELVERDFLSFVRFMCFLLARGWNDDLVLLG